MSTDLRFAARSLRRAPGFATAVILTLGLGIGANTAVFTALNALLLEPLPFPEPEQLVSLYESKPGRPVQPVSLLDFLDWEEQLESFESIGAYRLRTFGLEQPGETVPQVVPVGMVTSGFLPTLRAKLALGRGFTREEEIGELPVVVIGHGLWQRHFAADETILGKSIALNEVPHMVVGVLDAPLDFAINGRVPDLYIPLSHRDYGGSRQVRSLEAIGRLRGPVRLEEARAEVETLGAQLATAYPDTNKGIGAGLRPLHEHVRGKNRRPLLLLLTATALLLGVACVNVAGLLLERLLIRTREVALRAALGAGSLRLLRPFLLESLLLSAAGGLVALGVAHTLLRILPLVIPLLGKAPLSDLEVVRLQLDLPALGIAMALSAATAVLFGLAPGLVTRRINLSRLIKQGGQQGERYGWIRRALVAGQISLSLVLLFSTGLLGHSFLEILYADPGFQTENVVRFGIGLPETRYDSGQKLGTFHRRLQEQLVEIPGVESAGAVAPLPLGGRRFTSRFVLDGAPENDTPPRAAISMISPGYLETLRIPLIAGRTLSWRDGPDAPRVVLVNEAFRKTYLVGQDAVGGRLRLSWTNDLNPRGTKWEVVGVIGNTRQVRLEEAAEPGIYLPMGQFPPEGCNYLLRGSGTVGLTPAIRERVMALDSQLERIRVSPMNAIKHRSLGDRRLGVFLMGAFAAIALLLTGLGIYSAVAIHANRRGHEMAIRIALGARPRQVATLIFREGLLLVGAGIVIGCAGAWAAGGWIRHLLYNVPTTDPASLLAAGLLLALAALLASVIPARRAARPKDFRRLQDA